MKRLFQLLALASCLIASNVHADEAGNQVMTPKDCGLNVFSAFDFICKNASLGATKCSVTVNSCGTASQELFTGLNIELASPSKNANWTGFGGMGEVYQSVGLCLMRDLKTNPIISEAKASVLIGDVSIKQKVQFSSWNPTEKKVEAYQREKVCAPAIGCLDIATQKFTLKAVTTDKTGSGEKVGEYYIYKATALELNADTIGQALLVTLPAIEVNTPYGTIDAKPEFGFGRAIGYNTAPFEANNKSLLSTPLGQTKYVDLYGRTPGMKDSQTPPYKLNFSERTIDMSKKGHISQIGLGSRDANIKNAFWAAPPTEEFPLRPDFNVTQARSKLEHTPNAYVGASVKVTYDPTGLLPDFIKNSSFIKTAFEVFAKPKIDVGFSSQLNLRASEAAKWDAAIPGDYRPNHLDQFKTFDIYGGTSAAALFALESGIDLTIKLRIPLGFTTIKKTLIDIHPRAILAEAIDDGYAESSPKASVKSQASQIMATKKYFQEYNTLKGAQDGILHLKSCMAAPAQKDPDPEAPVYEPGDPSDLLDGILYPCNVCVGMNSESWKDILGKVHTIEGFLQTMLPSDYNPKPASTKWSCDLVAEVGCYDLCSYDQVSDKTTVVKTAVEMVASGELKSENGGRMRCR